MVDNPPEICLFNVENERVGHSWAFVLEYTSVLASKTISDGFFGRSSFGFIVKVGPLESEVERSSVEPVVLQ